jgi:4-hydroxybenzoate polyprenyltransferase
MSLGRVSNLPTVWTNVLAGVVLAGGSVFDQRLPLLLLALSLCYVAGMYLNDAFDRRFDAQHRPERPIPSGQVTATTVFTLGFGMLAVGIGVLAWVGYGFADGTQWRPVVAGLALGSAIILYDWYHKGNPLSPVVMGLCRMLVYVTAAYAVIASPPARLLVAATLLLSYLVGLTYIAKQEHLGRVANLWPLLLLALPVAWGAQAALAGVIVAGCAVLLLVWTLFALSFLRRRRPGDVPRAVGYLLAGICLWDALVISANGEPGVALAALGLFALTLLLQRFVAPT